MINCVHSPFWGLYNVLFLKAHKSACCALILGRHGKINWFLELEDSRKQVLDYQSNMKSDDHAIVTKLSQNFRI